MSNFTIRIFVAFLVVVLQISFFSSLFSSLDVPIILVSYAVILTIVGGFKKSLPWMVTAALIFDLLAFNPPGLSVIPLTLVSYGTSFISRKIWLGNKAGFLAVAALFAFGGNLFAYSYYYFVKIILEKGSYLNWQIFYFGNFSHLFFSSILSALVLLILYSPLKKMEDYLSYFEKRMVIRK